MAILRKTASKFGGRINSSDLQTKIQQRAYKLFQKRGYTHGKDLGDWLEAERQVKSELGLR